jgi:hypothetical protein
VPDEFDSALRDAMKKVATALKGANVPFALSGGYASWARGGPEPVHDVDFVLLEDDVPRAVAVLEGAGMRIAEPPEDWLVKVYDGACLVDLIFRPSERPVSREQLDKADEMRVDSVRMPVQSATDLMVAKLLVLGEHYCDLPGCSRMSGPCASRSTGLRCAGRSTDRRSPGRFWPCAASSGSWTTGATARSGRCGPATRASRAETCRYDLRAGRGCRPPASCRRRAGR